MKVPKNLNILFIRHAMAFDKDQWANVHSSDFFRPITKKGTLRFANITLGISRLIPRIKTIFTSQMIRSVQTSEILHSIYPNAELIYKKELNPESPAKEVVRLIKEIYTTQEVVIDNNEPTIAIIGHQVELIKTISLLLTGNENLKVRLKKGGCALVQISDDNKELKWLMNGKQISELLNQDDQ